MKIKTFSTIAAILCGTVLAFAAEPSLEFKVDRKSVV